MRYPIKTDRTILKKILDKKLKIKNMSRQLNFYATDADRKIIADILREHFGEMIEVPSPKDSRCTGHCSGGRRGRLVSGPGPSGADALYCRMMSASRRFQVLPTGKSRLAE